MIHEYFACTYCIQNMQLDLIFMGYQSFYSGMCNILILIIDILLFESFKFDFILL
jgi:hypothetical protein